MCLFFLHRNSKTWGSKLLLVSVSQFWSTSLGVVKEEHVQTAFRTSFAKRSIFQKKSSNRRRPEVKNCRKLVHLCIY